MSSALELWKSSISGGGSLQKNLRVHDDPTVAEGFDPVRSSNPGYAKRCKNPDCRSGNIITDWEAGDIVCADCGWVQQERVVDPGREWRQFEDSDEVARVNKFSKFEELYDDKAGISLQGDKKGKHADILKAQFTHAAGGARSARDRTLDQLKRQIDKIAARLPGDLQENHKMRAIEIFMKLRSHGVQGHQVAPSLHMVAACLWMVCYLTRTPYIDVDFIRTLAGEYEAKDDPSAKFKKAKRYINSRYTEMEELKQLAQKIKNEAPAANDEESRVLALYRRWLEMLGGSESIRHAMFGVKLCNRVIHIPECNGMKRDVCQAAALYLTCQYAGVANQATLKRISELSGVNVDSVTSVCERLAPHNQSGKMFDEIQKCVEQDKKQSIALRR